MSDMTAPRTGGGSAREVFRAFLTLGLTSFGGPVAHLGYFRAEFVQRRAWLDDASYADLVALCQFLPGPASSQVGFGIGLHRAGMRGALAAFIAFTLPSAVLMTAFAFGASLFGGTLGAGLLAGLKIVAVAVIAQAVFAMAHTLTPDRPRAAIAVVAATAALLLPGSLGQLAAIVAGAVAGWLLCRPAAGEAASVLRVPIPRRFGIVSLVIFVILILGMPILTVVSGWSLIGFVDAFFRSGSLVFGGGHVVLPLLHGAVVDTGWVPEADFLAGYGAAQAMPGPLFTFAAYLGAVSPTGPGGVLGAAIALLAIFLPGFLLLIGVLPFWDAVRARPRVQAMMGGANAAVVGLLAAALYSPVFTSAVLGAAEFCLALLCFVLLVAWRTPPWIVVILGAAGGVVIALAG